MLTVVSVGVPLLVMLVIVLALFVPRLTPARLRQSLRERQTESPTRQGLEIVATTLAVALVLTGVQWAAQGFVETGASGAAFTILHVWHEGLVFARIDEVLRPRLVDRSLSDQQRIVRGRIVRAERGRMHGIMCRAPGTRQ